MIIFQTLNVNDKLFKLNAYRPPWKSKILRFHEVFDTHLGSNLHENRFLSKKMNVSTAFRSKISMKFEFLRKKWMLILIYRKVAYFILSVTMFLFWLAFERKSFIKYWFLKKKWMFGLLFLWWVFRGIVFKAHYKVRNTSFYSEFIEKFLNF